MYRQTVKEQIKNEYQEKEIKLTNKAFNPFEGWSDWYSENDEAVITFITMDNHLFEKWRNQAQVSDATNFAVHNNEPTKEEDYVTIYEHNRFKNDFDGPGIYQDSTHYLDDNKVDESYTVIIPDSYMSRERCEIYLEKLNEKYDRNFYFEDINYGKRKRRQLKEEVQDAANINDQDLDEETVDFVLKTIRR